MAKAYGNLGNTFKSLKNYDNAIKCCEAHLEITRELGDRLGEVCCFVADAPFQVLCLKICH